MVEFNGKIQFYVFKYQIFNKGLAMVSYKISLDMI